MVSFNKIMHDFGDVKLHQPLFAEFQYTGDSKITIGNIVTHCGCTSKSYDPETNIVTLGLANDEMGKRQSTVSVGDVTLIIKKNTVSI